MRDEFRTTVRFDRSRPDEEQAAQILQGLNGETGTSYGKLIAPAILSYYKQGSEKEDGDALLREKIHSIVHEEMKAFTFTLGDLLSAVHAPPLAGSPVVPIPATDEPDDDELGDVFDCFGN